MKLKAYHSILIFAILVMSAAFSSVSNYRKAQSAPALKPARRPPAQAW